MARPRGRGAVFVARKTFASGNTIVRKGDTVREGHPMLSQHPQLFEPVGDTVRFEWVPQVETATAAPGEKRAATLATSEPKPQPQPQPKPADDEAK